MTSFFFFYVLLCSINTIAKLHEIPSETILKGHTERIDLQFNPGTADDWAC